MVTWPPTRCIARRVVVAVVVVVVVVDVGLLFDLSKSIATLS